MIFIKEFFFIQNLGYTILINDCAYKILKERTEIMENIYPNVLISVDGSQQSIDAFKTGIREVASWGSSNIYLVQIISEDSTGQMIEERLSFLNALEDFARKAGVTVQKEVIHGDPREQIAEHLVNRWDIDLIIMGATGKGRVAKMVVGSVTTYVLQNALTDVLVCR